jgi:sulfatase maturation enzyme AslB (radical SAM superfamily)
MPAYLSIALTNVCDLECSYCYAPKNAAKLRPEDVLRWCIEADAGDCFGVGFGGGEPTLFPGFGDLVERLAGSTSLSISFTTHAHHLSDDLVERLSHCVHFVRISMDGTGEVYERLRGRPFAALVDRVRTVATRIKFGVNVVVNDDTVTCLDDVARTAFGLGARQLLLLPEVSNGLLQMKSATLRRLEEWVNLNTDRMPLSVSALGSESLVVPRLNVSSSRHQDHEFLHIDASGTLKRCAFDNTGIRLRDHPTLSGAIARLRSTVPLTVLS